MSWLGLKHFFSKRSENTIAALSKHKLFIYVGYSRTKYREDGVGGESFIDNDHSIGICTNKL